MYIQLPIDISSFYVTGINYIKTDAIKRGKFAINNEQYKDIIDLSPNFDIKEFFVLSTCNRTEIYGFANDPLQLSNLICTQTEGTHEDFLEIAYTKNGTEAIEYLFNVAAGLDSQILGDYEITSQIKNATKFSRQHNCLGSFTERMVNEALQASKNVRTNTDFSSGTVSVSFAAVQFIKAHFENTRAKNILLIGTGKIGSNTCKNLVDYLPGSQITLINRSPEKAVELALQYNLQAESIENLQKCITNADIIVVAANADKEIIVKEHFKINANKLIIDLSVPNNVSENVKELPGITLINVDELSKVKDKTLKKRKAEIPKVKLIIAEHVNSLLEWHQMRKHVPVLKAVKNKLHAINSDTTVASKPNEEKIQKVLNGMAVKMRTQNKQGCHYIEAINDFITIPTVSN